MGLFGYNEKDYNKNTEIFKGQITNIQQNLFLRGIRNAKVGPMLASLIITMDKFEYPRGKNGKVQQSIDNRIAELINSMNNDSASKNTSMLLLHANMLLETLDHRSQGIEPKSAQDYAKEETMATLLGQIQQINESKMKRSKRMEEIQREADRLDALGADEDPDLEIEYNNLVMDNESDDMLLHSYREQYNQNYEILKREKESTHFEKLADGSLDVMSDQALGKMLDKMAENVEKHANKLSDRRGMLDDYKKSYAGNMGKQSSSNSFAAERERRRAQAAAENVNKANFDASSSANSSENNAGSNKMNG